MFYIHLLPNSGLNRFRIRKKQKSRVKSGKNRTSGKFGHPLANSGNPDETAPYEPSHLDFHCLLS